MYYRLRRLWTLERRNKPYRDCRIESLFLCTPLTILFVVYYPPVRAPQAWCATWSYLWGSSGPPSSLFTKARTQILKEELRILQHWDLNDCCVWCSCVSPRKTYFGRISSAVAAGCSILVVAAEESGLLNWTMITVMLSHPSPPDVGATQRLSNFSHTSDSLSSCGIFLGGGWGNEFET